MKIPSQTYTVTWPVSSNLWKSHWNDSYSLPHQQSVFEVSVNRCVCVCVSVSQRPRILTVWHMDPKFGTGHPWSPALSLCDKYGKRRRPSPFSSFSAVSTFSKFPAFPAFSALTAFSAFPTFTAFPVYFSAFLHFPHFFGEGGRWWPKIVQGWILTISQMSSKVPRNIGLPFVCLPGCLE